MAKNALAKKSHDSAPGAAPAAAISPGRPALRLVIPPARERVPHHAGPFVKWVGGKTRLMPALDQLLPREISRYAEPFVGGGAVYFHLQNEVGLGHALLADLNRDVVNVWQVVRDQPQALIEALRRHEATYLSGDEDGRAAYFYSVRERHPDDHETGAVERAARMLFLNRTCFNGLWRENRSGHFNTPHGRYRRPRIAQADKLLAASAILQDTEIVRADFRQLPKLARAHDVDFVYLDPPYHPVSATSAFNAYSRGAFTALDQAELAQVCAELDAMGVRFMLSNSDCDLVRKLYRGFDVTTVQAPRAVNCKGDRRGSVAEVVVRNRRAGLPW